ncbi:MAG: undecaprenyldiphospho-muramoylpentapeptide beta-N-acetylglucosaminyltransferase [Cytophagales bacterium]|jgi:UDP-N-acetylglucosamine--N-acetylmuramyl-(pentapeptide) pyrophosphoryl-undecaprenol N-acetylglucosamine transferase|nr:undecaprenyldiphospho-muramoylpentapeptide beta-N-acetylglucosaminyltransferase [Cytophagales bacterium]
MRILIACGGTGGHIYPGLALAKILEQQGDEILFLGCQTKMEMILVPQHGYSIVGMPIAGLNRKNIFKNIFLPYKILRSVNQACKIMKSFLPDIIIGTGGYAQFPVVLAGYLKKIPIFLQEQNAIPGLCNKICQRFAKKVFTAYEGMEVHFGKKNIFFGNPVFSPSIPYEDLKKEAYKYFRLSAKKPIILFLGGSLGSTKLINFVFEHVDVFRKNDFQVILSIGKQNKISKYAPTVNRIKIFPYIERMDYIYAISTIVVSRAGALGLSELSNNKKAAIIVPSPYVANNHQMCNAKKFEEKGAVILIEEPEIDKILMNTIIDLIRNENKRRQLETNIAKFDNKDAAEKIINYIKS